MRRIFAARLMLLTVLSMTGCGHDHDNAPPAVVTQILSDPFFDGDIELTFDGVFIITQGNVQTVFAGIDPGTSSEFRAFLDFPLSGAGGVPLDAVILSATLDIFIDSIRSTSGFVPIRIDLVAFQPPNLVATDFDRNILQPLATITFSPQISSADVGRHVTIDVTPLMITAQNLGLVNFQVRILEDFGPVSPGLIEITADRGSFAPLLTVAYNWL